MADPGWYPDPLDPAGEHLRMWDGQAWTIHQRPVSTMAPGAAAGPTGPLPVTQAPVGGFHRRRLAYVLLAAIVVLSVIVGAVAILRNGNATRVTSGVGPTQSTLTLGLQPGAPGVADTTSTTVLTQVVPVPTSPTFPPVSVTTPFALAPPAATVPPTSATPAPTDTTPPPDTTVPPGTVGSTTTTSVSPRIQVFQQQGHGKATTASFRVRNPDWSIDWSYTCVAPAFGGFSVIVRGLMPATFHDTIAHTEVSGSGSTIEHPAGTFYLSIVTACDWTITVTG